MDKIYDYAIVEFSDGVLFCKAPFGYSIKPGDLVELEEGDKKGKVLAVEMATESNNMLNLLSKINYANEAEKITAVYSKKEIEWKEEEND